MYLKEAVEREELALRALVRLWEALPTKFPGTGCNGVKCGGRPDVCVRCDESPENVTPEQAEYWRKHREYDEACEAFMKLLGLRPEDDPEDRDDVEDEVMPVFAVYEAAVSFVLDEGYEWCVVVNRLVQL